MVAESSESRRSGPDQYGYGAQRLARRDHDGVEAEGRVVTGIEVKKLLDSVGTVPASCFGRRS